MDDMEISPVSLKVGGPDCEGCKRNGKALMLSYQEKDGGPIVDVFLDKEQLDYLAKTLKYYTQ